MKLAVLSLSVSLLLCLTSCTETVASAPILKFTAIPDHNSTELSEKFGPLATHLSTVLGVTVQYVPTASYPASVDSFKNGDVQLAWFGGLTGVQARDAVEGARAIAQGKSDPTFKSYFIVNSDTGIERSDEFPSSLAGKSFTFGSEASTSGRLMPEYHIRENSGQSPEEFFGAPSNFSGGHDKTAILVQAGTFDAGALNYKTYDKMVASGKLDPERCRIVWVTPDYADYNWTAHPSLDQTFGEGFTDRLAEALVSIIDPALLAAVDRPEGMIPASNEDFEAIRQLATQLKFLR
ncbi:MAG: phosphonate transport system substrate-binding protein [Planctomycetota bacterium]|jgi:phosphonate transport system substrate-binding protein